MTKAVALLAMVLISAASLMAQETLSNADVIKLAKAGLSESFVLRNVTDQPSNFTTEVSNLIELRDAGVSERVISAMVRKNPPQEALNSSSIVRLSKAGFSETFLLERIKANPGNFRTSTDRIVELKSAGLSETILAAMMDRNSATKVVSLPPGTSVTVRLIDDIDSERDQAGADFRASVDEPVMVDGRELIPRGADAKVRLVSEQEAGRVSGRTELTVQLISVGTGVKAIPVRTASVSQASGSRTARTAKTAAGVGAVGAISGAIAGGGKGAAIGAASGAAVGAGAAVLLDGEHVRLPSETLLTFTTASDLSPRQ